MTSVEHPYIKDKMCCVGLYLSFIRYGYFLDDKNACRSRINYEKQWKYNANLNNLK